MEMNNSSPAAPQTSTTKLNQTGFQPSPTGAKESHLVSGARVPHNSALHDQGKKGVVPEMRMKQIKTHREKRPLTFGDFVAGVFQTWGKRRAKGIIDLAIKVHVIEFRGTERFVIS
jgi:hypothetical protein